MVSPSTSSNCAEFDDDSKYHCAEYENGGMGQLLRWLTATHPQRYHAHDHSAGKGHLYQARFKSFPVEDDAHILVVCPYIERNALSAGWVTWSEAWNDGSLWEWVKGPKADRRLLSAWPTPEQPTGFNASISRRASRNLLLAGLA